MTRRTRLTAPVDLDANREAKRPSAAVADLVPGAPTATIGQDQTRQTRPDDTGTPPPSAPQFLLSFTAGRTADRLIVGGELDRFTAPLLADALTVLPYSCRVDLDLSGVTFLSLSGLDVLLKARQRAHGGGRRLSIVAASEVVERMLRLTKHGTCPTTDVTAQPRPS